MPNTNTTTLPNADLRDKILDRLNRIEGQVRGIKRMVEEERPCLDTIKQVAAAAGALQSVGREMMKSHLGDCLRQALNGGMTGDALTDELVQIMERFRR